MDRYVLTRPVTITAPDFWGRPAEVTLEPTEVPGWFWKVGNIDVPFHPGLLHYRSRRLAFIYDGCTLNVVEHLIALRILLGLENVRIVSKTSWLPYDGRAMIFWEAIKPVLRKEGVLVPMRQQIEASALTTRNGFNREVVASLGAGEDLLMQIQVDFPDWGAHKLERRLPARSESWEDVISARSLGNPTWLRKPAEFATKHGLWPHAHSILWPQVEGFDVPKELARHRLLDLAGAWSVVPKPGEYLVGTILSYRAGHEIDVQLVRSLDLGNPGLYFE